MTEHTALWAYHLWHEGQDEYSDEEIEVLEESPCFNGEFFECYNCHDQVHCGGRGYNEQVKSYIRFGPIFICGECMNEAFDLPNIPSKWPNEEIDYND